MLLRTKLHGKTYEFPDLRVLMGKANEEKSGDRLAGLAAETAAERIAARLVLAEVPLRALRETPAVPYDQDEVTRVIQDAVNETIYTEIKDWKAGELREWILADATSAEMIRRISSGLTAEMIAAVTKLMSNLSRCIKVLTTFDMTGKDASVEFLIRFKQEWGYIPLKVTGFDGRAFEFSLPTSQIGLFD